MATADSVKAKILGLIVKANQKTGTTSTDMTEAVDALIAGYGQGGGNPSGTKIITENGTYDVAAYASAAVNVYIPDQITELRTVTIASDLGNGANTDYTLLSADSFVKEHYADEGFSVFMLPVSPAESATGVTHFVYHGNRNIGASDLVRYGVALYNTNATTLGIMQATAKLSGSGYNVSLRANSSGNINIYVASARIVKAGTYLLVMTCNE